MSLMGSVSLKLGPLMLVTALQHFMERHKDSETRSKARDEILFDEAFAIVRAFMEAAASHTIEQLQEFANTRIPAPPSVRVIRLLVPLSSCNEAAEHLIRVLGGPEEATQFAGGTHWWQVRGLQGIDANWIAEKRDIDSIRKARRDRSNTKAKDSSTGLGEGSSHHSGGKDKTDGEESIYPSEMDEMPCILYLHGGGYFFGSVDQERYCMQRYARKIKGRVFAINYRLAPQYPFPCALQDALAAYLYLIQPPPNVHTPIPPSKVLISGDSAGGGLSLALLQLIRDAGLPKPAGAILISPWCDMTHSFPSVFQNTPTDVIPKYGLGVYRPSTLWPPPPEEATREQKELFSRRLRSAVAQSDVPTPHDDINHSEVPGPSTALGDTVLPADQASTLKKGHSKLGWLGSTLKGKKGTHMPKGANHPENQGDPDAHLAPISGALPVDRFDPVVLDIDGQRAEIHSQIQLYAMNYQLTHPLVSPAFGYLGGLPPLYILVSDKEVLRDEIIFVAHKAARPSKYPVKDEARRLYPILNGIEERYGPTDVHLQVYDETCHVLPLFSFTTPAKFCYRAIATFCKYALRRASHPSPSLPLLSPVSPVHDDKAGLPPPRSDTLQPNAANGASLTHSSSIASSIRSDPSRINSSQVPATSVPWTRNDVVPNEEVSKSSPGVAGNPLVYRVKEESDSAFMDHMIRERVATHGLIRPLEPEETLAGCTLPVEKLGLVSEVAAKRYLEGQALWDKKYKNATKKVARHREKNRKLTLDHASRVIDIIEAKLKGGKNLAKKGTKDGPVEEVVQGEGSLDNKAADHVRLIVNSPLWTWSWALEGEIPPPSSIVARGDTSEARSLSKSADIHLDEGESRISGNNLWAVVLNALSSTNKGKGRASSLPISDLPDDDSTPPSKTGA